MSAAEFQTCMNMIQKGDQDALQQVYEAYKKRVYAVARAIVKEHNAAEDITSEVFLKLYYNAVAYREEKGSPNAWLMRLTHNTSIDYIRKTTREIPSDTSAFFNIHHSETEKQLLERLTIEEALKTLGDTENEIVALRIYGDLKFKQISQIMQLPLSSVAWKYKNAINKLRRVLDE